MIKPNLIPISPKFSKMLPISYKIKNPVAQRAILIGIWIPKNGPIASNIAAEIMANIVVNLVKIPQQLIA